MTALFLYSFIKYLLSAYCVLSAAEGAENRTDKNSYLHRTSVLIDHKFNPKHIQ